MFNNIIEQISYIRETYPEVTDSRIDESHWDLICTKCQATRGFQVVHKSENGEFNSYYGTFSTDHESPHTIYFRCPVCKTYKQWIVYKFGQNEDVGGVEKWVNRYYRVASLPSEGVEDLEELPAEPTSLRIAYKQAIRAMDANAHIAAAAMFRRALQVITRNILGAKPAALASELKSLVGKKFNGVTITQDFADVGYIIKEAGNQGAHPDDDPDLLNFTAQDAEDLQQIFMELVGDLFVVPEKTRKVKEEFLKRRKIVA